MLTLVSCGGSDSSDSSTELAEDFFSSIEFPHLEFQAKSSTGKNADGDTIESVSYTYTETGEIATIVETAETALIELEHDETTVYAYDEDGNLTSVTAYSDADKEVKTYEITSKYEEGVIQSRTKKTYNGDDVTKTEVITYDAFGRVTQKTYEQDNGDTTSEGKETCEYETNEAFSNFECTQSYDDVKTKEEAVSFADFEVSVRTFASEDDDDGSVTYSAELNEEYRLIDDDDDFAISSRTFLVDSSETTSGDNTITEACEIVQGEIYVQLSCESTTTDSEDNKTSGTEKTYSLVSKKLNIRGQDQSGVVRFTDSTISKTFTDDKVSARTTQTYERNDRLHTTDYEYKYEILFDDDDDLDVQNIDTTTYTYDNGGQRILSYSKEREEGDGDISGVTDVEYIYDDDDDTDEE